MAGYLQSFIDRQFDDTVKGEVGIGGFTALVRVREAYKQIAEVPGTPVEDGSVVHDHIILKPLVLTIEGEVSDVYLKPSPSIRAIQNVQAEIGNVVSQYAPARTQAQLNKVNVLINDAADAVRRIDNLIDTGAQVLNLFGNEDTDVSGLQEQFIGDMDALYRGRQTITIDMPFRQHKNMVITSLTVSYDNQIGATTFNLEATQIKFAELQFTNEGTPSPGLDGQVDGLLDNGTQAGGAVTESFLTKVKTSLGDFLPW